ncbi:ribosome biogenesis factor YjgA [Thalassotalea ganghwensis]
MPESAHEFDEEFKSKTEIKREMIQLQEFAMSLVKLSKHQRSKVPFSEELKECLMLADKIKDKPEALRRHVRFMAKVLLETDLAPIKQALDVMANKHQQESTKHIKLENLRDQLIEGDNNTVESTLSEHTSLERQKLRQLIRLAAKEKKAEKPAKHYQQLFSYLKEHVRL